MLWWHINTWHWEESYNGEGLVWFGFSFFGCFLFGLVWVFFDFLSEKEHSHSQTSLSYGGICFKKINVYPQILGKFRNKPENKRKKKKTKNLLHLLTDFFKCMCHTLVRLQFEVSKYYTVCSQPDKHNKMAIFFTGEFGPGSKNSWKRERYICIPFPLLFGHIYMSLEKKNSLSSEL